MAHSSRPAAGVPTRALVATRAYRERHESAARREPRGTRAARDVAEMNGLELELRVVVHLEGHLGAFLHGDLVALAVRSRAGGRRAADQTADQRALAAAHRAADQRAGAGSASHRADVTSARRAGDDAVGRGA